MVEELPQGYYLTNFKTILDFVDAFYADILSDREKTFSAHFRSVSPDAQRLYVRLISRKGPHFRSDRLNYEEISDLFEAATELEGAGLLAVDDPQYAMDAAMMLLRKDELLDLLGRYPGLSLPEGVSSWKTCRKEVLLEALEQLEAPHIPAELARLFQWYTTLYLDVLLVYRLLFFGNLSQDLTEFVLVDLGLLRYENYAINRQDRLFSSRGVVDDTLLLAMLRDQMYIAVESGDVAQLETVIAHLPDLEDVPGLIRRRDRILEHSGRFFERAKLYDKALTCYELSVSHPSRERSARIFDRQGNPEQALALCQSILAESADELEREFALQFRPKMQKKLGLDQDKTRRINHPTRQMILRRDDSQTIEAQVLAHLHEQGIKGFYSENHFWLSLFGLLFWDIIFMPVRGAFFNPYQRGPKGFFSGSFREQRTAEIDKRLEEIRKGISWRDRVLDVFDKKQGIATYFVHWPALDRELLISTMEALEDEHVAAICERLTANPGAFKTGLPDLFVFDEETGYILMEVKGPSDQLQDNQRRWLRYFARCQIPYCVAKIIWAE